MNTLQTIVYVINIILALIFFVLFIRQKYINIWIWRKIYVPSITIIEQNECKCKKEDVLDFIKYYEKYNKHLKYKIVIEDKICYLKSKKDNSLVKIDNIIISYFVKKQQESLS